MPHKAKTHTEAVGANEGKTPMIQHCLRAIGTSADLAEDASPLAEWTALKQESSENLQIPITKPMTP